MTRIELTVDGDTVSDDVEPRMLLVQYLREKLGKTGTVIGCDTSNCGACTVHLDGRSVKSCNVLAVQANGCEVTTIEGLAKNGQLHPVQAAFHECHALQCGFCTPGMIMQSVDLLNDNPNPDARTRSATGSRATSAAAPATTTSSVPCRPPRPVPRGCPVTATQDAPAAAEIGRDRRRKEDAAADHRPHPVDRQHDRCRACSTWPWCAAPSRTPRSPPSTPPPRRSPPNVVAVYAGGDLDESAGRAHQRLADHHRPGHACPPADPGRPSHLRRRDRRRGRRALRGSRARRRRAGRRRLRGAAGGPGPQGGGRGQGPRAPRPRHQQVGAVGLRLRRGRHRWQRRGRDREGPRATAS